MQAVAEVLAVPGVGLEGDRYALKQGTSSARTGFRTHAD